MLKEEFVPSQEFHDSVLKSIEDEIPENATSVEKGKIFLKWVVKKLFDVSDDDFQQHYTDRSGDYSIDFWMPDPSDEEGSLQLFQMKYGKSHKEGEIEKFQKKLMIFLKWILLKLKEMI